MVFQVFEVISTVYFEPEIYACRKRFHRKAACDVVSVCAYTCVQVCADRPTTEIELNDP